MTRKKQVRKRKTKQVIFFLVLIIVAGIVGFLVYDAYFKDNKKKEVETEKVEEKEETKEEVEEETREESRKKEVIEENGEIKKEDGVRVIDENDPNNSETVTGYISNSGVKGDYYKIMVVTEQALSEGECKLELENGDATITETAEVTAHPNSASCSFKIDNEKVLEGKHTAKITITTTGDRSGIITGEVEK